MGKADLGRKSWNLVLSIVSLKCSGNIQLMMSGRQFGESVKSCGWRFINAGSVLHPWEEMSSSGMS